MRLYRQEISGISIGNDAELQTIISMASKGQYRDKIRKQMIKEFQVVDGYPVLDEYTHTDSV